MNRFILFWCCAIAIVTACSCQHDAATPISKSGFIQLKDNHFQIDGEDFFPMMLNYIPSFQSDSEGHFIVAPHVDYDSVAYVEAKGKEAVARQLDGHFQLVEELGFNTLRICFDRMSEDENGRFFYKADRRFYIDNQDDAEAILAGVADLLACAERHHLHVMLLIKPPMDNASIRDFTIRMLKKFRHNQSIFAYDFMNEPLYFDPAEKRAKTDARAIVEKWRKLMRKYAPYHLFTIGFSEPLEVFEWDPSILPVDFVEVHTYHPLRVPSEIYWYAHYIGKPWMIGETGLPADNDSISYLEQRSFMVETYQLVRDAGGAGFGWWEFQELTGTHFEATHTGLLNHEGRTVTADGKHEIYGTLKPAAACLKSLSHYSPRPMELPSNYYNMMGYRNICITGTIIDEQTGKGVEGAVIRGWNQYWSIGMNTYSDQNGHFTLFCNDECVHFEISAPGMSHQKFNKQVALSTTDHQPFNVQLLENRNLEYHQISYHPFLKVKDIHGHGYRILQFDPDLFTHYTWTGDLGVIPLKKLK